MVLAALALCSAAACGSEGSGSSSATLAIETRDIDEDHVTMKAPGSLDAGRVEIELRNRGDTPHDAQLFRIDGNRTGNDIIHLLEEADGAPKPNWLHPAGGVAPTSPGKTATVTQILQPGTYYVVDTQERTISSGGHLVNAARGGIARIEVNGEGKGEGELPETSARIVAKEYGFETTGIVAGANRVTFHNAGRQFHQAVAFPVGDDIAFKAARRAVLERQRSTGWVPVDAPGERATTVIEGGGEQVTELTFDSGRYLLLCFVSDRTGGGPQWRLGMNARLDVPTRPAERGP